MCAPVLPALAIASAVIAAGGQVYSGMAARNQANYEAKVDQQNAQLASRQAADANDRGAIAAQQNYQKLSVLKGQQQAAMAANGIDTGFGTALNTQEGTAMIGSQDTGTIYRNTAKEVQGYDINAANYQDQAAAAKAKGSAAMTSALFGAASTALGAASQYGQLKAKIDTGKVTGAVRTG